MLQGISLKKKVREKERKKERIDMGGTRLSWNWSVTLFFREAFILWVVHRDKHKKQSHAGLAALTLIETRLSLCIPICIHRS